MRPHPIAIFLICITGAYIYHVLFFSLYFALAILYIISHIMDQILLIEWG